MKRKFLLTQFTLLIALLSNGQTAEYTIVSSGLTKLLFDIEVYPVDMAPYTHVLKYNSESLRDKGSNETGQHSDGNNCYANPVLYIFLSDSSANLPTLVFSGDESSSVYFKPSHDSILVHFKIYDRLACCYCTYLPVTLKTNVRTRKTVELIPDTSVKYIFPPTDFKRPYIPGGDCFYIKINGNMHYIDLRNGRILLGNDIIRHSPAAEIYKGNFAVIDPNELYSDSKGKEHKGSEIIKYKKLKRKKYNDFADFDLHGNYWKY